MELQVRLEPLAVRGEPLVIAGWICGTLVPASAASNRVTQYGETRIVNRPISSTGEFLLDYVNVVDDQTTTATTREKRLCSVIGKHGVIRRMWGMPTGLPTRCADWWQKAEKSGCVPFALEVEATLLAARQVASYWDLLRALQAGEPDQIAAAQLRRGLIEPSVVEPGTGRRKLSDKTKQAITDRVDPLGGLLFLSQQISALLKSRLALDQDEYGSVVMSVSADSLESALLLALCDEITAKYRRCKTCGKWFSARGEQVHCGRKCRIRASVYRARAVVAVVKKGMGIKAAAERYFIPIDELRERVAETRSSKRARRPVPRRRPR